MVLERLAKPPGVCSPCRFEPYTLRLSDKDIESIWECNSKWQRVVKAGCGFKSHHSQAAGSFPDMQELSVVPAEIIKMLMLVDLRTGWQIA